MNGMSPRPLCRRSSSKIAGMRDWMAHAYFAINDEILWDAIETKVPELLATLQAFKADGDDGSEEG